MWVGLTAGHFQSNRSKGHQPNSYLLYSFLFASLFLVHDLTHTVCSHSSVHVTLFMARATIKSVRGQRRSPGRSGAARLKIRCRNTSVSSSTGRPSADRSLTHCPLIQGRTLLSFLEGQLKLDSQRLNKGLEQFGPPLEILPAERFQEVAERFSSRRGQARADVPILILSNLRLNMAPQCQVLCPYSEQRFSRRWAIKLEHVVHL